VLSTHLRISWVSTCIFMKWSQGMTLTWELSIGTKAEGDLRKSPLEDTIK
jgi:hypothetical protein